MGFVPADDSNANISLIKSPSMGHTKKDGSNEKHRYRARSALSGGIDPIKFRYNLKSSQSPIRQTEPSKPIIVPLISNLYESNEKQLFEPAKLPMRFNQGKTHLFDKIGDKAVASTLAPFPRVATSAERSTQWGRLSGGQTGQGLSGI